MVKPRHLNFIKLYVLGAFMDFYESYHITQNIRELITPLFMFKESWDILLNFSLGVPKKKVRFDRLWVWRISDDRINMLKWIIALHSTS